MEGLLQGAVVVGVFTATCFALGIVGGVVAMTVEGKASLLHLGVTSGGGVVCLVAQWWLWGLDTKDTGRILVACVLGAACAEVVFLVFGSRAFPFKRVTTIDGTGSAFRRATTWYILGGGAFACGVAIVARCGEYLLRAFHAPMEWYPDSRTFVAEAVGGFAGFICGAIMVAGIIRLGNLLCRVGQKSTDSKNWDNEQHTRVDSPDRANSDV